MEFERVVPTTRTCLVITSVYLLCSFVCHLLPAKLFVYEFERTKDADAAPNNKIIHLIFLNVSLDYRIVCCA